MVLIFRGTFIFQMYFLKKIRMPIHRINVHGFAVKIPEVDKNPYESVSLVCEIHTH
jgi:hypothetical protein